MNILQRIEKHLQRSARFLLTCLLAATLLTGCGNAGNSVSGSEDYRSETELSQTETDRTAQSRPSIETDTNEVSDSIPTDSPASSSDFTPDPTDTASNPPTETRTDTPSMPTDFPEKSSSSEQGQPDIETGPDPIPEPPTQKTAEERLAELSLEEKVGQMFIARCPTTNAAKKAAQYHLGGYILFARDFSGKTPAQVTADIQSYQAAVNIPLLIAVDEEGGTVTRVSRYPAFRSERFPSPQELYQAGGFPAIRADAKEKARLLKSLGINVNFAPVCDVSENPSDYIYKRTLGQNAELTAKFVQTVVEVSRTEQIGSTLKHFPGYGNNTDTHTGIAYDNRPYETFLTSDFLPFRAGIESGADLILVSHNIVRCIDEQYPASLSPRMHEILRTELGFDGVIVTDDLAMQGVQQLYGEDRSAVLAIQAGNDLLCSTNFETQIAAVLSAVKRGELTEAQIDTAVLRILKMKQSLGIL